MGQGQAYEVHPTVKETLPPGAPEFYKAQSILEDVRRREYFAEEYLKKAETHFQECKKMWEQAKEKANYENYALSLRAQELRELVKDRHDQKVIDIVKQLEIARREDLGSEQDVRNAWQTGVQRLERKETNCCCCLFNLFMLFTSSWAKKIKTSRL